jgi:predicted N-formylglutamate amidohydrolase
MKPQSLPDPVAGTGEPTPLLLGPDDPAPFERFNVHGRRPVLLICDHASRVVPRSLDDLGLDEALLRRHIGWDIGAPEVTRRLARALDAPAILGGYSRLVIDLNRRLDDPTSICAIGDGVIVPGNRGLDPGDVQQRVDEVFQPYHQAVVAAIAGFRAGGVTPAIISVHSCTPVMRGFERPWHIGVLWDRDGRLAVPLIDRLRAESALCVGDNEPYSGRDRVGYSIDTHATPAGLPNVLIEIRQDLIDTHHGAEQWADLLAPMLDVILADPGLYQAERP